MTLEHQRTGLESEAFTGVGVFFSRVGEVGDGNTVDPGRQMWSLCDDGNEEGC